MKSLDFTGFLKKFFCTLFVGFLLRDNRAKGQLMGTMLNSEEVSFPIRPARSIFDCCACFQKIAPGERLNIDCGRWEGKVLKNVQRAILSVWGCVLSEERAINPKSAAADV